MSRVPNQEWSGSKPGAESWLATVQNRVQAIQYGVVQITIHEGRVTQVDATEKLRIPWEGVLSDGRPRKGRPDLSNSQVQQTLTGRPEVNWEE
jgi:hypothetical protein